VCKKHFFNTSFLSVILAAATLSAPGVANAIDLIVNVENVRSKGGSVGCALYTNKTGFPGDLAGADNILYVPAEAGKTASCVFEGLATGKYAVSVTHDRNDNKVTDKNFLGIPKEPWGVSNNIRKMTRPPRFEESSVQLDNEFSEKTISIKIR